MRVVVCLAALLGCGAFADTVYLKNGKSLDGEVIREDKDWIVVRVPSGEIKFKPDDVEAIERQTTLDYKLGQGRRWLAQRQHDRAVKILEEAYIGQKDSIDAKRMLATAYEQQSQRLMDLRRFAEARAVLENLLKIDPKGEVIRHSAEKAMAAIRQLEIDGETLLNEARERMRRKDWKGAIEAYGVALAYTPDVRGTVATEVAQCHVQMALQFANAGAFMQAAAQMEAAMQNDPTLADRVERVYVSYSLPAIYAALGRGDIRTAKVDLARMMTYVPTSRSAMYVAGRIEQSLNNLGGAADNYARALRTRSASSTPEHVAELRRRVESELSIEGNKLRIETTFAELTGYAKSSDGPAKQLETENFVIHHYNDALAQEVAGRAESERLRLTMDFHLKSWPEKAKIYLHRTQGEYTARTGLPEWTAAVSRFTYDGTRPHSPEIHTWQTSPRLLTSTVTHEIMHLLVAVNATNGLAVPRSLHEGFAVYAEPRFRQDYMLDFLKVRLKSQNFIPLADLLTLKNYPQDPDFFYSEGYALILYMVSLRGREATIGLLKTLNSSNASITEVLKLAGTNTLESLEANWKQWILDTK